MKKIEWKIDHYETVGKYRIPCVPNLKAGYHQGAGIKRSSKPALWIKRILWPLVKFRADWFTDGFIERSVGRLIRKYLTPESVFLEVGCGDMSLRKYLPKTHWYNALDLEISDLHILRVLKRGKKINLALASATDIPAESNVASLIVSTETFEHIPEIDKAIDEIHRVAMPGAVLICSIPNNYCYKYVKKGPHLGHINNWHYDEFIAYMQARGYEFIEGFMKGWWIPLPRWLTKTSWQLPFSSREEYYNTNFFYVFRIKKAPRAEGDSGSV